MARVALTLGDPGGIGPEIVAAVARDPIADLAVLIVGDAAALARAAPDLDLPRVTDPAGVPEGRVALWAEARPLVALPPWGVVHADAGAASHAWVVQAAGLARAGRVQGVVTAPIHKQAWRAAGIQEPGHTEVLAREAGVEDVTMCFVAGALRVALATIHVPLRSVPDLLDPDRLWAHLQRLDAAVPVARGTRARIALCGLNPHAGEGGLLGSEDAEILHPLAERARAAGLDVTDPLPADAALPHAWQGRYDAVLAMYHDQALPAVKALAPRASVNCTLGLPFVRTSVDHGTAFDIAGRGRADAEGLRAALREAALQIARASS